MKRLLPLFLIAGFSASVSAVEYRSVNAATVLYDAPSQRGGKLFVIKRETPVEVVVNLEGWSKVRDAEGGLAWIDKKYLADKRTLTVRIGKRATQLVFTVFVLGAFAITAFLALVYPLAWLGLLALIPGACAILIVWTYRQPRELVVALSLTSLTSLALAGLLCWAFVG